MLRLNSNTESNYELSSSVDADDKTNPCETNLINISLICVMEMRNLTRLYI